MRFKCVLSIVGMLLFVVGLSALLPLGVAIYFGERQVAWSMFACLLLLVVTGASLSFFISSKNIEELSHREGMFTVGFGWLIICLCGALPYLLSGVLPSVPDALFESFSGFTTTGATIIPNVDSMPQGILVWRALSHWLGGIGIIVMFLAMLPFLGIRGAQVYRAELPEFFGEKVTPRVKETAKVLCVAYFLFTFVLFWLFLLGGMKAIDALCHTFTIVASGGFANHNDSMAAYTSPFLQWVAIVFMFLAGMNFAIHHKVLQGKFKTLLKDEEFHLYFLVALLASVICGFIIWQPGDSMEESMRQSAFQAVSIMSTTGLITEDYEKWPFVVQSVLLLLMLFGGCAGSTAGGLKNMRVLLLLKCAYNELFKVVHPKAVRHLKLERMPIPIEMLNSVANFLVIYIVIFLFGGIFLTAVGIDLITAFTSALSCLSCVGPSFGVSGPVSTYADFPNSAKVVLAIIMLLGRIEVYALLVLLMPEFWRK